MDTLQDKVRLFCSCDEAASAITGQFPIPSSLLINQITGAPLVAAGNPGASLDTTTKLHGSASLAAEFSANTRFVESNAALYALTPANPQWTVELWVYRKHATANFTLGKSGQGNVSYTNWILGFKNNGGVYASLGISGAYYGTSLGGLDSAAGIIPIGAWTHVALVLNGANAKIYVGGVLAVNFTVSQHPGDNYPLPFYVGVEKDQPGGLSGYLIDDLRITSAVRYTGPFTPEDYSVDYPPLQAEGMDAKVKSITAIPANQEARSQFQPQDVAWNGKPGSVYGGPMLSPPVRVKPLCQGQDLAWIRDGVQNVLHGYIESTVTIDGEGVRRRVLCWSPRTIPPSAPPITTPWLPTTSSPPPTPPVRGSAWSDWAALPAALPER
ncbi:hypothetical protein D3C80_1059720 [compost metagenome]